MKIKRFHFIVTAIGITTMFFLHVNNCNCLNVIHFVFPNCIHIPLLMYLHWNFAMQFYILHTFFNTPLFGSKIVQFLCSQFYLYSFSLRISICVFFSALSFWIRDIFFAFASTSLPTSNFNGSGQNQSWLCSVCCFFTWAFSFCFN